MANNLKEYMKDSVSKTDSEQFKSLELSEKDKHVLKSTTINSEPTVSALVNLVLREKAGNVIKEENREYLFLRGFISENDNITRAGKDYIETDEVKERLNKLLQDE